MVGQVFTNLTKYEIDAHVSNYQFCNRQKGKKKKER